MGVEEQELGKGSGGRRAGSRGEDICASASEISKPQPGAEGGRAVQAKGTDYASPSVQRVPGSFWGPAGSRGQADCAAPQRKETENSLPDENHTSWGAPVFTECVAEGVGGGGGFSWVMTEGVRTLFSG